MKDTSFNIKISDLLQESGRSDVVIFEKKFSDQVKNLGKDGISGKIKIESIGDDTLIATLSDVQCKIKDVCDTCEASFDRNVKIDEYIARFENIPEKKDDDIEENKSDEVVFPIENKDAINIEDMVAQSIILNEPFVKRCDECTKKFDAKEEDDDMEGYSSSNMGNIVFR